MKGAVLEQYGSVKIREMDIPQAPSGEIILKVTGCGVCGTDVHLAAGDIPLAKPPVIMGHEIAAEVYDPGKSGGPFEKGEPVTVDPVVGCGNCVQCRKGKTNLCSSPTIIGYVRSGGFCQYLSVPIQQIYSVPESLGPKGGILVETLACVLNGYQRLPLTPGDTVLILGAGSVGLLWLQLIKHSLSSFIVQTDKVHKRLETAVNLGTDLTLLSGESPLADLLKDQCIKDFDVIIDATGNSKAISEALPFLGKGGRYMLFGVCSEEDRIQVSPYEMFLKEQTLLSAKMPPGTFDQSIRIIEAGIIDSEILVNRVLPLDQTEDALRMFVEEKDKAIKMMIDPWI